MKQTITLDTMSHGVTYAKGFQAIGIQAGLKKSGKHDLALIYTDKKAAVAGTFTQNKVAAAPVYVSKETVATGTAHAIISNSGCANACTGAQGLADAHTMAKAIAEALHCSPNDIIVGSTGIIGQQLPINDITKAIPTLVNSLSLRVPNWQAKLSLQRILTLKLQAHILQLTAKTFIWAPLLKVPE